MILDALRAVALVFLLVVVPFGLATLLVSRLDGPTEWLAAAFLSTAVGSGMTLCHLIERSMEGDGP